MTGITPSAAQARRPNIVIFFVDDMGYGDVGCLNPHGRIPTPRIDRFASQGLVFTDAHSSSAVCSPSRYSLLTGRYNWRSTLQAGIVGPYGDPLIAPDRTTIASLLKRAGHPRLRLLLRRRCAKLAAVLLHRGRSHRRHPVRVPAFTPPRHEPGKLRRASRSSSTSR